MIDFLQASQTFAALYRTFLFSIVGFCFALKPEQCVQFVDGALVGAILADYLTWFIISLARLPGQVLHGSYNLAINITFGWLMFHYLGPVWHGDTDTTALACISFLLVAAIKVAYYSLDYIQDTFLSDDEPEET